MRAPVHSATSILSSPILRPRGAACSNAESRSVGSGTRHPLELGTEVLPPGSTPHVETMQASPTSPTQTATAGCSRKGATAMCEAGWKPDVRPEVKTPDNGRYAKKPSHALICRG